MTLNLEVPQWLADKCNVWVARLSMEEWTISLLIALAPNDDVNTRALAEQYPDLNFGRITVRADVEDDEQWESALVHELLHIKHSRIDAAVQKAILPQLQGGAADMAEIVYRSAVESYIYSMAWTLVRGYRKDEKGTRNENLRND